MKIYTIGDRPYLDIPADEIPKRVPRSGFFITCKEGLSALIKSIFSAQSGKVIDYLITNANRKDNQIIISRTDLARKADCALPTVNKTLDVLRENNVIATTGNLIMINPLVLHTGDQKKEERLIHDFKMIQRLEDAGEDTTAQNSSRKGFLITYPDGLSSLIRSVKSKRAGRVVEYLMTHAWNEDNSLVISKQDLSKATACPISSLERIISTLRKNDIISTNGVLIMINPHVRHQGDWLREAELKEEYERRRHYHQAYS